MDRVRLVGAVVLLCGVSALAFAQAPSPQPPANFFTGSLHYTNRGIEYWYAKEQGGLERITGLSATEIGCVKSKCHVESCDVCHKTESQGKAAYSAAEARTEKACEKCHPQDPQDVKTDVHFSRGMRCMSCHTAREIHGDGVAWNSCLQAGAMDANCENCHGAISKSVSHTVHGGKLDCTVCHVADSPACLNCHVGARLAEKKDVQIPLEGMLFLVNRGGKVTVSDFLTYVHQKKTMITFAPWFRHLVVKKARACGDCHNSQIVRDIKDNRFRPVRWENGEAKTVKGVIPVVDPAKWGVPFLDLQDGKWVPLQNAETPVINYSGWCSPLTPEQFAKLEQAPAATK